VQFPEMYREHGAGARLPVLPNQKLKYVHFGKMIAPQSWIGTDNGIRDLGDLAATMGKLTSSQIDEYFAVHLPYRTRILWRITV
jgi:hypothetical protein